jgi:hypothetical protein
VGAESPTLGAQSDTAEKAEAILVSGFVLDSAGEGIEGAQVEVENMPALKPEMTGSSGRFIVKSLPGKPGDWIWLVVTKDGYRLRREEYQLNGEQKQITLYKTK